MDKNELREHLDLLLDVSLHRKCVTSDYVCGRVVRVDPEVERYKIDHTGGRWMRRDDVVEYLVGIDRQR